MELYTLYYLSLEIDRPCCKQSIDMTAFLALSFPVAVIVTLPPT